MTVKFPKWKDMTVSVLREGPHDGIEVPIAPTMKNIIYKGERYFRMDRGRAVLSDGSLAGHYLWEHWPHGKPETA